MNNSKQPSLRRTTRVLPEFTVNLRTPPTERWDELLTDRWAKTAARKLIKDILEDVEWRTGTLLFPVVKNLIARAGKSLASSLGELDYMEDVEEWSTYAIRDEAAVLLANYSYELHGLFRPFSGTGGLCSAANRWLPNVGPVHLRNLDWPLPRMSSATVLLHFKGAPAGPFTAVSVPGMVGVLSGVARGRFSATVNSQEDDHDRRLPNFRGWAAGFLLRWLLEHCRSYDDALRALRSAPAFVPFFVMLVGPKRGQSAVVELRLSGRNRVLKSSGAPLCITNHFPRDMVTEDHANSEKRLDVIARRTGNCRAKTTRGALAVLRHPRLTVENTQQSMVMNCVSGEVFLADL